MSESNQLLADYAKTGSDAAFKELDQMQPNKQQTQDWQRILRNPITSLCGFVLLPLSRNSFDRDRSNEELPDRILGEHR